MGHKPRVATKILRPYRSSATPLMTIFFFVVFWMNQNSHGLIGHASF